MRVAAWTMPCDSPPACLGSGTRSTAPGCVDGDGFKLFTAAIANAERALIIAATIKNLDLYILYPSRIRALIPTFSRSTGRRRKSLAFLLSQFVCHAPEIFANALAIL